MKLCETQGCTHEAVHKERFCLGCKKVKLKQLSDSGYLTARPFRGSYRGEGSREKTNETKHGPSHG